MRRRAGAVAEGRHAGGPAGRRRTAAALLSGLAALVALAGCGIRESDVVEAGGAATVIVGPVPEDRMVLYFLGPDGRTMPVVRDVGRSGLPPVGPGDGRARYDRSGPGYEGPTASPGPGRILTDKTLAALLAGPRDTETAAGVTTALPGGGTRAPRVEADPAGSASARLLRTPFAVRGLSEGAVLQLVCTTAYAEHPAGRIEVTVSGPDGTLPAARCEE
ncbi:hypothetical protein [Streptomyces sp. NPDC001744]|uniref:hypothetical protein n=1 Tax=Streptomyces sp. NPDC001744 TaxID=3364606 RepID=UPI0036C7D89D